MDLGIKGKVALVTAASKGLGRGCAEHLAAEGCKVALCARNKVELEQTAKDITRATGAETLAFTCDMSQADQINQLLQDVRSRWGDPEIVISNAGGPPPGTFASTKLEQFAAAVELTLMSSIRLTYGVIEAMQKKGWGRIVYITSISVKQPVPHILLSNTMRAGVTGFMKTVARETAGTGVTLNAVLPGAHETERVRTTAEVMAEIEGISVEDALARQAAQVPMKRLGTAKDFGAVAAFLCSQHAGFITGENVLVDGGAYAGLV